MRSLEHHGADSARLMPSRNARPASPALALMLSTFRAGNGCELAFAFEDKKKKGRAERR